MKMKKKSVPAILTAVLLVAGVTAVFATSKVPEPKNIDALPQAAMTNTVPRPDSVLLEKHESIPDTSFAIEPEPTPTPVEKHEPIPDTSSAVDPEPTPTEMKTPDPKDPARPAADEPIAPVVTTPEAKEPAGATLENRWGVPEGEIPQWTEFVVDSFEDASELGKYLEETHGLYPYDYTPGGSSNGIYTLQVHYSEREIRKRLPDGVYPVNSKGQTYGTRQDYKVVGYDPDLCAVQATNGVSGYVKMHDLNYCGYPGSVETLEEAKAYFEWQESQPKPITIPVYDVDYDQIVGYFAFRDGRDSMTQEEELEMIEDEMRTWGISEERIAEDLERYKQNRGW